MLNPMSTDPRHVIMVETDYTLYAAVIECDEVNGWNIPQITSTAPELDMDTVERY